MASYLTYVGPPTAGIWEVGQETTDVAGNTWLCTQRGVAGQPGTAFLQIGEPTNITSASNSASVAASVNVAIYNNLGYDAVIGAYLNITAASVVTVSVGVGSTSPPTTYPVVSAYTSATPTLLPVTAYVPNGEFVDSPKYVGKLDWMRRLRDAALLDENGTALDGALKTIATL